MIYKQCIMTINKNNATLDEDIYLFRLDKNIELHFTIVNNKYKFDKSDLNNIIAQTNAAYFQIRLYRSDEIKYTFAIQPTQDGVAVLTITDDLINDPIEVGEYDFQISLLDADKTSMISMPIVKQQLHVCEPLVDNQAIMGRAVLGLSSLASGEIKNAFDSEGNYIREIHNDGDILSAQLVNKFEEALDTNTKAIKSQDSNLPHTISSKVLVTVPASNVKLNDNITVNNVSINKDRRYYIEFLGSKKLCTLLVSEEIGNCIVCSIGNYSIQAFENSTNIMLRIELGKNDITTNTFTDLVIYEEEVKYLDSKYLETDLVLQNSISMGRVGKIGAGSSAIGVNVIASGDSSHAEGDSTTASAYCSHAEGNCTTASGENSHSEGASTIASSQNQHVQGKYNIEDLNGTYAHIVGNGEDGKNSNAHTLDWQGNAWYAGKLSQEGTPTEDKDLVTKKYVDDKVTVKILPVDYNKNCATNVADLEPHSIYMSPNDAKFLYLGYEKLDGSFSGLFLSGNPHGKFIYTGAKDDTKIEVMLEGICHTAYFKTDTVEPHTERTVFYLTKNNTTEFTPSNDYEPATKKYVDDNILLEQLPILRIDETNKRIYVNCNNMGTYKKYFVPNKYANVYGFSFIYTNEDSSETEIALVGGAMTRDDFILCARNTDTLFILILGDTDKYKYTKSTKTLEKGLYGYLKIGNTQEYTPTNDYNPATKKYVDDKVASLPQLSFNEAGELVVTINGVSKTFVPKTE